MNRIAIVDDSDINLTLLSALVRRLGDCEPLLFQDSPRGLAWCAENRAAACRRLRSACTLAGVRASSSVCPA